ncbi:hypothetical protein PoB_001784700 [Plakobranchus ocellatus]|uniref:Uncharacterized protein n=1 Tax=Plakobranchus ocellatus TaxID=259542 RepID=A0AAV3Z9Y4_9GAST|nr:hypothetical protein PoB_001784700 [Plakobranchus ocellatus]
MKTASPPQRFQADRFLDMLAKTFDPKVAYADLLAALHQRLNLEPPTSANTTMSVPEAASGSPTTLEAAVNCPEAVPIPGTVVTYTSEPHVRGSRAFYQTTTGDLRLFGPPSGRGADGGARTRDRRVPADLKAYSQATVPRALPKLQRTK